MKFKTLKFKRFLSRLNCRAIQFANINLFKSIFESLDKFHLLSILYAQVASNRSVSRSDTLASISTDRSSGRFDLKIPVRLCATIRRLCNTVTVSFDIASVPRPREATSRRGASTIRKFRDVCKKHVAITSKNSIHVYNSKFIHRPFMRTCSSQRNLKQL